jgi:hypothetical protein
MANWISFKKIAIYDGVEVSSIIDEEGSRALI